MQLEPYQPTTPREAWPNAKQRAFLLAYSRCGRVTHAADHAGLSSPRQHYEWLKADRDGAYARGFELAQMAWVERLEAEAVRRAADGVEEPVYYKGEVVGHRLVYSDQLLMFLLRGAAPEKYRERQAVEYSGPGGGPIEVAQGQATEQLKAALDEVRQKLLPAGGSEPEQAKRLTADGQNSDALPDSVDTE